LLVGHGCSVHSLFFRCAAQAKLREHLHQLELCCLLAVGQGHGMDKYARLQGRIVEGGSLRYSLQGGLPGEKSRFDRRIVFGRRCEIYVQQGVGLSRREEGGAQGA